MESLLTAWDIGQIRRLQMLRWRARFPVMSATPVHIGITDNCLNIHCATQQEAAETQINSTELTHYSFVMLGVSRVRVWLNNEEVWAEEARPFHEGVESGHEPSVDPEPMPTATLDRPTTTANTKAQNLNKRLPGQSLQGIASDLEINIDELRTWLESNGAVIIPYSGDEIVTGEMAIMAYQQFEKTRLQRVMERRGLLVGESITSQNGSTPTATAIATPSTEAPTKPARKTSTRKTTATAKKTTRKPAAKAKGARAKKSTNV